ncbi:MAG: L,D-transpeptidase [Pseudomonadota bacterium]
MKTALTRRGFLAASAAAVGTGAMAQTAGTTEIESDITASVKRNIASFRSLDWRPYFNNLDKGAILVDIQSRALHFWSADESVYKLFPTSVPLSEDLTRTGRTSITRKVEGPTWAPTPAMKIRNPEWPDFIGPGPDNPMGTHALHLTWQYYRIHGTHDTRKIGRRSSNGCIGLYNEQIAELYELSEVGTQVLLI